MKLYDSNEKTCECGIVNGLNGDLTISFVIEISKNSCRDYKLITKGKDSEINVSLTKSRKLYFYYANTTRKVSSLKSDALDSCTTYHVVFIRSLALGKNLLFINGVLVKTTCIPENFEIVENTNCVEIFNGDCSTYALTQVKLFNCALTLESVHVLYAADTNNKKELLKYIFCHLGEMYQFDDNVYHYILTKDFLISFDDISKSYGGNTNELPEYAFTLYNIENQERSLCYDEFKVVQRNEMCRKYNMNEFAHNLISWQIGLFETLYPKGLDVTLQTGYWSQELGTTPFTPYLDNTTHVANDASLAFGGTLKNGNTISFLNILVNQFLKTTDAVLKANLKICLGLFVDYLISVGNANSINVYGIQDVSPVALTTSSNDEFISLKDGNYVNWLKLADYLLSIPATDFALFSTAAKQVLLKTSRDTNLTLLLNLQLNSGIWATFYKKTTTPMYLGNTANVEPQADLELLAAPPFTTQVPFLDALESAQVLSYLMNLSYEETLNTPLITTVVTNACAWFVTNTTTETHIIKDHVQFFWHHGNGASNKLQISKYLYGTGELSECDSLWSHYYAIEDIPLATNVPTLIVAGNPVIVDVTNVKLRGTDPADFPANFNAMQFVDQPYAFGTWGACVACDLCPTWTEVYVPCVDQPTTSSSCNHCNHCCH